MSTIGVRIGNGGTRSSSMRIFWNGDAVSVRRLDSSSTRAATTIFGKLSARAVVLRRSNAPVTPSATGTRYRSTTSDDGPSATSMAALEQQRAVAERRHRAHVVADEEHRAAVALGHLAHLAEALLLEVGVADGQHLVDDQDLGLAGARRPRTPAARTCRCE